MTICVAATVQFKKFSSVTFEEVTDSLYINMNI